MPINFRFFLPHVIILFFTAILLLVLCIIASRFGGDEFLVVMPDSNTPVELN